jgi:hypothetical protein
VWFDKSPEDACGLIEGIEFRGRTLTVVARGQTKVAYVVFCTDAYLAAVIKTKRGANSTYTATAGSVIDSATFWGAVGRAYTENNENQVTVEKALAKKNMPDALCVIRDLEIKRGTRIHDRKIAAAEKERGVLETAAADGDVDATSKLRKIHGRVVNLRRDKSNAEAAIMAKYDRPIMLSEELETKQATKKADARRQRRNRAGSGKGINSKKRRTAVEFDESDEDEGGEEKEGRGGEEDGGGGGEEGGDEGDVGAPAAAPAATPPAAAPVVAAPAAPVIAAPAAAPEATPPAAAPVVAAPAAPVIAAPAAARRPQPEQQRRWPQPWQWRLQQQPPMQRLLLLPARSPAARAARLSRPASSRQGRHRRRL